MIAIHILEDDIGQADVGEGPLHQYSRQRWTHESHDGEHRPTEMDSNEYITWQSQASKQRKEGRKWNTY
jgi:hypothetical protein